MTNEQRFAMLVMARRQRLGLSQRAAWKAGGPSGPVWTDIENATGPAPQGRTLAKLDKALQWVPGSARRAVEGGDPVAIEDATPEPFLAPSFMDELLAEDTRANKLSILFTAQTKKAEGRPLSPAERRALQVSWEDAELATFQERWDLLPRHQQLAISRQVDALIDQEASDWVAEYGDPEQQGDQHEEAQQEPVQGARSAPSGGSRSGASNIRAAESAALDEKSRQAMTNLGRRARAATPSSSGPAHAGISGTGPDVPVTQDDLDLARGSLGGRRELDEQRAGQDDDALMADPEGPEDGA